MMKALASATLISVIAISTPLVFASTVTPFSAGAHAAGRTDTVMAASRIGKAFAALSERTVDPAIAAAAAARAPKGDFAPACANAVWPSIDAACLATADGRPAPHVRTITIGYPEGATTTVLERIPVADIAQR